MIQPPTITSTTTSTTISPTSLPTISSTVADADSMDCAVGMPIPSSHSSPAPSPRPRISIERAADAADRPAFAPHLPRSAPPAAPLSPMRHHKRTPSHHREVKETLDAKYTNDEIDGRSQYTVNQYVIGDEIGRGSYGAVHRATDQFKHEYAVKEFSKSRLRKRAQSHIMRRPGPGVLHQRGPGMGPNHFTRRQLGRQEDAEAKDALYLIRAEIAIMKKLDHPNLVTLIEVLDDPEDDSLYMVLEMCKKGVVMKIDLDQQATPYDNEHCRTWFRDLILGIEYLHAQGIIHRDIKPDNLLLTEDDVLKIVDFGVSEMFEKSNEMMTNKSAGSPAFIPPELCQANFGDVSGKAADVWSMGVTLYCLKYGKLPFSGTNVLEMFKAIREKQFSLPEDEDPDFVNLITRILDKNSNTRIALPDIRNHPWVTKNGHDPLLSEEENCSDVVGTPNELEVNHAFTRKMDHLICVLRAIQRFKSLISQSRATTPRTTHRPKLVAEDVEANSSTSFSSSEQTYETPGPARQKSVAEEAAELIKQRRAYLRSGLPLMPTTLEQEANGDAQDLNPAKKQTLFLGIGTGGDAELSTTGPLDDIVSESPTGIDFDVYDRAFETEIQRIRLDGKNNQPRTYMTKLLGEKERDKYIGDDFMNVGALESGTGVSRHSNNRGHQTNPQLIESVQRSLEAARETGSRFADLVVSVTQDLKENGITQEQIN
ncbi:putative CAMKK META protein kinase [Rosellinia necatrix]|uniref:Putative CAMKK META protein kinase n=1 Tax=Rosellinia necatrix TaxID=77044 RepID=A0A1W2TLL9_ROSNE|nr:putative CAMKK META protein kinase [Rosellinia necatrix]